jgi:hypothetical protein
MDNIRPWTVTMKRLTAARTTRRPSGSLLGGPHMTLSYLKSSFRCRNFPLFHSVLVRARLSSFCLTQMQLANHLYFFFIFSAPHRSAAQRSAAQRPHRGDRAAGALLQAHRPPHDEHALGNLTSRDSALSFAVFEIFPSSCRPRMQRMSHLYWQLPG